MKLSMRARLMAGYIALLVVAAGATLILTERSLGDSITADAERRLHEQATAVGQWLERAGKPERLAPRLAWVTAADVLIVDAAGVVRGDSTNPALAGQPSDAPEVRAALADGTGRARRRLASGPPMYMVAVRTRDGGAVRVAVPLAELDAARGALRTNLVLASAIGLVAALVLGVLAIRTITRPLRDMTHVAERLARGDYDVPAPPPDDGARDELAVLSRTLGVLAGQLKARIGELTAARDLSAAVVDALVEGVVAVDATGTVVLTNRAAAALLGERPPTAPLAAPLAPVVDAARAGATRDEELVVAGREVRVAARPLAGSGGAVAVLYDVTQLRALDRVRRDFLASAAHELRTPVTAISGYAETLLGTSVDAASAREFLATIHRNAGRIAALVDDLLVLERLEARPERIAARAAIALAPIVEHAAASARAAITAAEPTRGAIAVEVDVAADAIALADRAGLEQVVQNLIDNALRHGGDRVRVAARRAGDKVILTVADDGPGIAAEHRERIFERFYRIDKARSRRGGGSGLGLAIVAQHVAAMGGTVAVASAPDEGATFTVALDAASGRATTAV